MKKTVPLSIPNKKINYSPQFRNMVEGENIVFGQEGNRVETINTDVIELLKLKTPEVIQEGNTLVASCATDGAVIFYTDDGSTPTVLSTVYKGPVTIVNGRTYTFFAAKNGMVESENNSFIPEVFNPFYFEAEQDNTVISFPVLSTYPDIEMSEDAVNWEKIVSFDPVTLAKSGDRVYFRGTNDKVGSEYLDGFKFIITGTAGAHGDITTLLDPDGKHELHKKTNVSAFAYLFKDCAGLTSAPELPATVLSVRCYRGMFYGCTGLTVAPELPAVDIAASCYQSMFSGCTGLTAAPNLPAVDIAVSCYKSMFSGCTGLTAAPNLPAVDIAESCYQSMFSGCTGLTAAPNLPATDLVRWCYSNMFSGCTGLTVAPELPAVDLANSCYQSMFSGCTGLTAAPELTATRLYDMCYSAMFYGCTGLTAAPELPAVQLANSCYYRMFYACTNLTEAPVLNATVLITSCYEEMFRYCSSLNYIKCLAEDITATDCTSLWTSGVSLEGTFVKSESMSSWPVNVNGIPYGWTVQDNQ